MPGIVGTVSFCVSRTTPVGAIPIPCSRFWNRRLSLIDAAECWSRVEKYREATAKETAMAKKSPGKSQHQIHESGGSQFSVN